MNPTAFLLGLGVTSAFVPQWLLSAEYSRWAFLAFSLPALAAFATWRRSMLAVLGAFLPVAVLALTIWWAPVWQYGVGALLPFVVVALAAVWASHVDQRAVKFLWLGVCAGLLPSLAFGLLQLNGVDYWSAVSNGATGLFTNRIVFGEIAALAFVATLSYRLPLIYVVIALSCLVAVLWTGGSREAGLAVAAGVMALLFQRGERFKLLALLTIVGLGLAWAVSHRFDSVALRLLVWSDVLHNLHWGGWGLGSFDQMYSLIATQNTLAAQPGHVHNDLLELIFECGAFALPTLALLTVCLFQWRDPAWSVLCAFMVEANVSFPTHLPVTALVLGVVVGRLVLARRLARVGAADRGSQLQPGVGGLAGRRVAVAHGVGFEHLSFRQLATTGAGHACWTSTDARHFTRQGGTRHGAEVVALLPYIVALDDDSLPGVHGAGGSRLCCGNSRAVQYAGGSSEGP